MIHLNRHNSTDSFLRGENVDANAVISNIRICIMQLSLLGIRIRAIIIMDETNGGSMGLRPLSIPKKEKKKFIR
jgi:hypothetical protein